MTETATTEPAEAQAVDHAFTAQTARVLQLMIHALYTNRDIFLRELISNASDACDKLRYAALTDDSLTAGQPALEIRITYEAKTATLRVADSGIGMNQQELIENLGTIAKSGTTEFISRLSGDAARDVNLIGQFGVGFYSAFMVANHVDVFTRRAGETQGWHWQSDGAGSYRIAPVARESRGTEIVLHLKPDAKEYLDRHRIGHIVETYSGHIAFPIQLTDEEGVTHQLNAGTALWATPKVQVSDEQYQAFYREVAHSPEQPWAVLHNRVEGALEYTNLLYIPGIKPFDLFHPERRRRVKLYVKRVFIAEEGVELVPSYLRFLRGVIDSADLPLNISRETLQKSPVLDKIRESVTGRVLSELIKRGQEDEAGYAKFWEMFGGVLKEGLCESQSPREKLLECCRFYSTAGEGLTSLKAYVSRMREGQEAIYYLTGDTLAALRNSPQIEGFRARGIEVLLLCDAVDDFWVNVTPRAADHPLRSVMKSGADLEKFPLDTPSPAADAPAADEASVAALLRAMQALYGDTVRAVRTTAKLTETPICLSIGEGDMDLRMERFLAEHKQLPARAAKLVEVNPQHPVIRTLASQLSSPPTPAQEDALWLLLDQALIAEGEPVANPAAFARRLNRYLQQGLAE